MFDKFVQRGEVMKRRMLAIVLALGLAPFAACAGGDYPTVPAVPGDSSWSLVLQTGSGLHAYVAKTSLKVLPDRSGFAVWLKVARPGVSSMAPMAAYMLHDCDTPRRMRLGHAVNLLSHAPSAQGASDWLADVPISTAIKEQYCPKLFKLKAQEERDRARGGILAASTSK